MQQLHGDIPRRRKLEVRPNQMAVVNRLNLTNDPVESSDGPVKVTIQHIVKAYPAV